MKKYFNFLIAGLILATSLVIAGCSDPGVTPPGFTGPVIDYTEAELGDIILSDGKICKLEDFNKDTMTAIAVIVREADLKNSALGIGLFEGENMPWCKDNTVKGYQSIPSLYNLKDSTTAYERFITSATDFTTPGNYPAWEYCATYGIKNIYPAPFNVGWCLPSTEELTTVGKNYNTVSKTLSGLISKVGAKQLRYNISNKTGFDTSTRQDKLDVYYYETCNQNGSNSNIHNLAAPSEGDKVTGRTGFTAQTVTMKLLARPVYHFVNNSGSLAKPFISEKKDSKITISTSSKDATICYKLDNEEWKELPAPAEITVNGKSHTITAYTKKAGLQNSKETSKNIPADSVY